jgi:uncharacterized protein DUF3300
MQRRFWRSYRAGTALALMGGTALDQEHPSPTWLEVSVASRSDQKGDAMSLTRKILTCVTALVVVAAPLTAPAQQNPLPAPFKAEELDQLVAPIALYPDPLLAQILMASTYPLEVVQAARFAKENPNLKGDQLNEALKEQNWDDSVKSLVSFPQVLAMMDAKLDWTQKLGDGFLAQQKEVMDAVQRLRARAHAEGNLKSTPEQKVTVEPATPAAPGAAAPPPPGPAPSPVVVQQAPPTVITIQPTNPQVVYVPTYNPTVVYGAWPYPAYPPYYYPPPGYVAGAAAVSFAAGVAVGAAVWGNCDWHGNDVNVNVNQYNNFTKNVNTTDIAQKRTDFQANHQDWQHNPENRRGAQYRDPATQQRYAKAANPQATQARESFRGRAEEGRQDLGRGGAEQFRQGGAAGRSPQAGQAGPGGGREFGQARSGGAFEGLGQGRDVQQFSNRGQASRQSMGAHPTGGVQGGTHGGAAAGGVRAGGGRRR